MEAIWALHFCEFVVYESAIAIAAVAIISYKLAATTDQAFDSTILIAALVLYYSDPPSMVRRASYRKSLVKYYSTKVMPSVGRLEF